MTKRLVKSPIPWFGGKALHLKHLLPLIPKHQVYVEVFGGGGSLLFAKKPAKLDVYNDVDSGLVCLFRVLRDPNRFPEFKDLVDLTPYSREEYYRMRNTWSKQEDELHKAHQFFCSVGMSFSGIVGNSWSHVTKSTKVNRAKHRFRSKDLDSAHKRLLACQIDHRSFEKILSAYDSDNVFFYLDPPYVHHTRRGGTYRHEIQNADQVELVSILLGLKGKAMLSGYPNKLYKPLERAGWFVYDYEIASSAAGKTERSKLTGKGTGQTRHERVWLSPNCETALRCGARKLI